HPCQCDTPDGRHLGVVPFRREGCLDAVPLALLRLFGLGAVGTTVVWGQAGGRPLLGIARSGCLPSSVGARGSDRSEPDSLRLPPIAADPSLRGSGQGAGDPLGDLRRGGAGTGEFAALVRLIWSGRRTPDQYVWDHGDDGACDLSTDALRGCG